MRLAHLAIVLLSSMSLSCQEESEQQLLKLPSPSKLHVNWDSEARTNNPEINEFVNSAVKHCVDRDYEEYRLLWSYQHEPTSRKHFERIWSAVEQVDIRLVKELHYRKSDGMVAEPPTPTYVFHADVNIKPQVIEQTNGQLDDRQLVLLITQEEGRWCFIPPPDWIKDAILDYGHTLDKRTSPHEPAGP